MNTANLIFDLDGTLIDSAPSILACMEHVSAAAGLKLELPLEANLIGPPLLTALARVTGLSDERLLLPLAEAFKAHYDAVGLHSTVPYPEIPEVLRHLRDKGMTLYLATNKRMIPTIAILEKMGWGEWFTAIYTLDKTSPGCTNKSTMLGLLLRENKIDPATAVYVGDTLEDGIAAAASGLHFIAADWGYGNFDDWPGVASWSRATAPSALLHELRYARNVG